MKRARLADVDGWMGPAGKKKPVSRALGTEHVAVECRTETGRFS